MNNFPLLILCAGFGKRMLGLTINDPKPLLKFNNQTLLGNTISFFKDLGCGDIFINTHYLHEKIEEYIIKNFYYDNINLIYEPSILGTGGGVKNIFNYTKSKNLCVVNSDIFWQSCNKQDIKNYLEDFNNINYCKILLSKNNNFSGLKNMNGDFSIKNKTVSNWEHGTEIIFYSGCQIVSKNIFKKKDKNFTMNKIWNELISIKKLDGKLIDSNILHIGDKNSFDNQ